MKSYIIFLFLLFTACSGNTKQEAPLQNQATIPVENSKPRFNAGDLLHRINCAGNSTLSYALYLPKNYVEEKKFPLIIFFDAHGDGTYPLEKYKLLADQYGYILMGSNDSKNGNSPQETGVILEEMVRSARTMLNSDSSRIYAAGFSGGARVAAMLALSPAGLQGLAIAGAGFPADQWYNNPPSVIVGIAGNRDMNLRELLNFKPKENLSSRFQLLRYNGKHEWPPEEVFETAFMAFESYAMRDKFRPVDQQLLQHIDSRFRQLAAKLNVGGRLIESKLLYEAWMKDLDGMYDYKEVVNNYNGLLSKPQFKMNSNNEQRILMEEDKLRQEYTEAIGTKDTVWWTDKMKNLQNEIAQSKDRQRSEMLQRVQGHISLATYSALSRIMRTNMMDTKSTTYLSAIYRIADSENSESWYLSAMVAAVQSNSSLALSYLEKCASTGFSDVHRVQTEQAFQSLIMSKDFEKILNKMRVNQNPNAATGNN